ncbi:hypothetical protein [Aeromicrobium alkaliterrae]|uniref:Secreted protein n=1 Tax=Aeromicrobium alkaliterrae TaxID=302168 RepID=A0ABP4VZP9_9ACTN
MKLFSKRTSSGLLAAAAAVVTTMALAAPAHAATTYTPDAGAGDKVNFVGSSVSFRAVQANQTLTCSTFNLAGDVVSPSTSRAYGANGGTLGSLTSSGCTNPIAGNTTVTPTGVWGVTVTGDATGTTWPAKLTSVGATVSAAGCTFNVGGDLAGTFNTATQLFTPGASTIKITSTPSGFLCPILGVAAGQDITVSGSWTNTPPAGSGPLTITNP